MKLFDNLLDFVPDYGRYCGPGRSANDDEGAAESDVPVDVVDCLGWLHDNETSKANEYDGWFRFVAWNTANLRWISRQRKMNEVKNFSSSWWSVKLGKVIVIPNKWDADYLKLYKSGSRRLFRLLSIGFLPFLKNDLLLINSIDESLAGPPPF